MLKRIKIRGKLLLLLVTPLLAVLVFAASGVVDRNATADEKARDARIADFADASSDLSVALTVERFQTLQAARLMLSASQSRPDEIVTNRAFDRWQESLSLVTPELRDERLVTNVTNLSSWMSSVLTEDRANQRLAEVIAVDLAAFTDRLATVSLALPAEATDLALFQALSNYTQVLSISESLSELSLLGSEAIATGEVNVTTPILIDAENAEMRNNIDDLRNSGRPVDIEILDQLQASDIIPTFISNSLSRTGFVPLAEIQRAVDQGLIAGGVNWVTASEQRLIAVNQLSDRMLEDARVEALAQSESASTEATQFLLIAGAVVLLAVLMALFVGRSISRPLTRLTQDAEQLSSEELPAMVEAMRSSNRAAAPVLTPIRARGRDEIAQLARAFSDIQTVTIDVAEEQSDLLRRGISDIFVNLARRNQSLLDRQIDFIDQLENREENPDQLENLFRLDHLATRMRRNAESLLVLAGAEPTRRRGRPVDLTDVVRVAMGEIEDFSRIEILAVDPGTVAGSVAVDLAHLMSELMENATQFSPPDTNVQVVGNRNPADGTYQVTLSDRGIGMNPDQVRDANETLQNPPIIGLDLSRSLGFTVVSRLAHRLGVSVRLANAPEGGVTAIIGVPASMIGIPEDAAPEAVVVAPEPTAAVAAAAPAPVVPEDEQPMASVHELPVNPEPSPEPASEPPTASGDGLAALPMRRPRREAPPAAPSAPEMPAAQAPTAPATPAPSVEPPAATPPAQPAAELPRRPQAPAAKAPAPPAPTGEPTAGVDLFEVFNPTKQSPAPPSNPDHDIFAPLDTPGAPTLPSRKPDAEPGAPVADAPHPAPGSAPRSGSVPSNGSTPTNGSSPVSAAPSAPVATPPLPTRQGASAPAGVATQTNPEPAGISGADTTGAGLTRRTPKQVDVPEASKYAPTHPPVAPAATTAQRSPDEVRQMLSRYRAGLRKGRGPEADNTTTEQS